MKKILVSILSLWTLGGNPSVAQKLRRLTNTTVLACYFGIPNNPSQVKGRMISLRNTLTYKITKNYGLGFGFGQENHNEPHGGNYNFFPIFSNIRYFFTEKLNGAEAFLNSGYAVKIAPHEQEGVMLSVGTSYPFSRRSHSNWNINLSYRYQEVIGHYYETKTKLQGIGLGIGLSFN